eukprot:TRINITY_DN54192_c0_g1_i1.p1 TRINITY_DN54192_c0_g1~~TRINITY_DN54192_c0_g1_i1.p1  ORF type:complete len:126 (+),score=41.01 TRINITY_DN54192_c0_g1_i1:161-538(+)
MRGRDPAHGRTPSRASVAAVAAAQGAQAANGHDDDEVQDANHNGSDGRPDGPLLGLVGRITGTGDVAGSQLAVDLGGVDDRHDAGRQAAEQGGQDGPDQIVGDLRSGGVHGSSSSMGDGGESKVG